MTKVVSEVRKKIIERLDQLEDMMIAQEHIQNPYRVLNQIASVSKFWSVLNDEDKDFIECARFATEDKLEWKEE